MPKASSQYYNKQKNTEYSRAYRARYPKSAKQRIDKTRREGYSLKDNLICERCGEDFIHALDFHHLDPTIKELAIANVIHIKKHREKVLEELKKCIVLCANCHRKVTFGANEILVVHTKDAGYVHNTLEE